MTDAEGAQIVVTARLLEAASKIDWLSTGLTLIAAASIVFTTPRVATTAALILGIIAKVYAVRVAFDARLLGDVGAGVLTSDDIDAAFPTKAGRSWGVRCRGAKRLVIVVAATTLVQCVALGWS